MDARESAGTIELAFAGRRGDHGVVAMGRGGKLMPHASSASGPLVGVVYGKLTLIAGTQLGICTEKRGIINAVHGDKAHSLVRLDEGSAVSLGASGCTYFAPLDVASWPELALEMSRPAIAFAAERTRAYAIDQNGALLRRSASWTWAPVGCEFRAKDPLAMWVGPAIIRIVCADGAIVEGRRSG